MSTLPSYPFPYFGNNQPIVSLINFLQFTDPNSNYPCAICGKSIIVNEGFIEGTDSNCFLLCDFCHSVVGDISVITEANRDAVYEAWGVIAAEAINPDDLYAPNSETLQYPWV